MYFDAFVIYLQFLQIFPMNHKELTAPKPTNYTEHT
jgi:hypothetical protein